VNRRLIIFDFDGTLADTLGWAAGEMTRIAATYRTRDIGPDEHDRLRTLHPSEIIDALGISSWKLPLITWDMRRSMRRDIDRLKLFPGIAGALRTLSDAGADLAILSSNSERNVRSVLGSDLALLIRHYQCGVSFFGKAGKLKRLLRKTGTDPADACFIGDELRDLEAARAAGIAFGAVSWGLNSKETFERQSPVWVFTRPEEICPEGLAGCEHQGP